MLRHIFGPGKPNFFGRSTTGRFANWLLHTAVFALALCVATPAFAGTWTQLGNLHTPRSNASVAVLPNGLVLVAGGVIGATALASAELYNPATGIFTITGSLATARQRATATMLANGTVLIAGGTNTSGSLASAEIYDPASGSFRATGSLTSARSHATATLLADGRVLLAGGISASASLASAELYDASSGQFASTGSLQASRYAATSALLPDGRVLIAGGHTTDPSSASIATTEIYDPTNGMFSAGATLTTAREAATATLLANGKVLIAGGVMQSRSQRSAELYDPVAGTSLATGSMADARDSAIAAALPSGMVLLAGGNGASSYLSRAEIYDPATGTFSSAGSMLNARAGASAVLLPNAQVLVIGGVNNTGSLARAESYDAASGTFTATDSLPVPCGPSDISAPLPDGRIMVLGCNDRNAHLYDPATATFTTAALAQKFRSGSTLTLLGNGRVLAAGGSGSGQTAEEYDSVADMFSPALSSMIALRFNFTATLLANGEVLMAGGGAVNQSILQSTEIYNPTTRTFRQSAPMLNPRFDAMATLLPNGKVLIAGGGTTSGYFTTTAAELYDPATLQFTNTGSLGTARATATATLLPNGKVLIAGGDITGLSPTATAELYDPASGAFSATGSMATARMRATAILLASGKVLVAGGFTTQGTTTASAELYDPATGLFSAAGTMTTPRESFAATLMPNGKVLIAGGYAFVSMSPSIRQQSAEIYDPGFGFSDARRAQLGEFVLTAQTQPLALNIAGNGFRASTEQTTGALLGSEANSGNSQNAATNFPLLQLRRIDNDQQFFISPDSTKPWTDSSFASSMLSSLPQGYYRATLYVNAIPSQSRLFSVAPGIKITAVGGDQQSAAVNTQFTQPLQAVVTDPGGNPVQGITVNFSCSPASNGACIYARTALTSDAHGLVSGLIKANTKPGSYTVQISAGGDSVPATFSLSNTPGAATSLSATAGLSQTTQVNTPFATTLQIRIADAFDNPVPSAVVTFAGPVSGATAILSNAAPTDANGATFVTAAANIVAGSYAVHASLGALATQFNLTNTPGPAARLVAGNGPDFDGIAGLALASAPAVEVTDSFGNPVSGIEVIFATTGTDSGSITESDTLTDSTGFANAGRWTLAPDPGTNTLQASAPGLTGSPVQFSALGSASVDVAVSVTNNRGFVQFGHTLDYVIVVTATGPSNAHNIQVTDVLPAQVDAANAHWLCIPAIGAACAASGTGNLVNEVADVPSGSSVTFVLSATVINDQQILDNTITNKVNAAVNGDTDTSNNVLTVVTEAVISRNGFEPGGDGSN